jgi:hypothetical protein
VTTAGSSILRSLPKTPFTNPAPLIYNNNNKQLIMIKQNNNRALYTCRTQEKCTCKLQAKLPFIEPAPFTNPAPLIRAGKFKPHRKQSKLLKFIVNSGRPFEGLRHTLDPNSSSKNDR